ncbi:hypothetical protein L917_05979 [Phytophthora nicotianae]|nr:hypothetical protein F443_06291 [Phytophthora nicotianae P1569]ETK89965.1 hypothetical protein L915_06166 [Phytophthora nicotianae]ETO78798.1 hypothetical protein F444_06349 [Phytophthora nicotianae P1976]ETL43366.1 hypothetical protein L916_06102 [Phytophthora nicotianae]ETL96550.1 hypothetical protein L917_05979 [Phytophthora nicotianae]
MQYKKMSTEVSCRKLLDVVAMKLAESYIFPCKYGNPTMGDVFSSFSLRQALVEVRRGLCTVARYLQQK